MPFALFSILVLVLLVATLLPLSRRTRWWIRDLDFPRLQIAMGAVGLLAAQLLMLDLSELPARAMVVLTAGCLLYQGWWIFPYTIVYPDEVKTTAAGAAPPERIRIMTANVLSTNRNAASLLGLIRQFEPDVFVTLESNAWWQDKLDTLASDYPYSIKCALENTYGMHVYSKLVLEDSAVQFLVEKDIPSMHALAVLPSGLKIRMHFLHPAPPSPTEHDASTERDAELLVVAKSVAALSSPVVVAGDLNDVAWSSTTRLFRKISGLLDPRIGRGMFNTFHADHWFMRWPLDHLFHSKHFTLSLIRRLPHFGSDHFPMLVELSYDKAHGMQQHGLQAGPADRKLAQEKINAEPVEAADVHEPKA